MEIWYDEIIFTDENEKYIDLNPHTNNPYTYELNKDKFSWEIRYNPDTLYLNESTGRIYGNISCPNIFFTIFLFYEDFDIVNAYEFFEGISYYCMFPHMYEKYPLFENQTINCENGYYGNRLLKCNYDEELDDVRWEIIDTNSCKEVKTKIINEKDDDLFEYEESIWINSYVIDRVDLMRYTYNLNINEISILSNEKDLGSGNVTITIQYTTLKKVSHQTIKILERLFCVDRIYIAEEFEYFFHTKPFYISYIEVIEHNKSNDLYLYIGIFGGIVGIVILVCVIRIICKYIVYKEDKQKETIQMI